MSRLASKPICPLAWALLAAGAGGLVWVGVHAPTATACVLLSFLVLLLYAREEMQREKTRLQALAASRREQSICVFARDFDTRRVDTWIIRAVYEQIQKQLENACPAFPIRADDNLKKDLLLDDEDVDLDLVPGIARRTHRSLDGFEANSYSGKVQTVRDLVMFFHAQPKLCTG